MTRARRASGSRCFASITGRWPSGPPGSTLTPEVLEATYGSEMVTLPTGGGPLRAVMPAHHHDHEQAP